jgi:putative heme iron utilization protein
MAADTLTPEVSDRICAHMNDDHADAVLLYAKVLGDAPQATAAKMQTIDPEGMDLNAEVEGNTIAVRIAFDHRLTDSEDAHQTLISLVRAARQKS